MKRMALVTVAAVVATTMTGLAAAGGTAHADGDFDPLDPGPHEVTETSYTLGDEAFQPTGFRGPVELTGHAYYPEEGEAGEYPVVVFLHGRHATCMSDDEATAHWPCPDGYEIKESYRGYDYLARQLASHGYAVISISANGINATDGLDGDFGQPARGELVLEHLDLWTEWQRSGAGPVPPDVARTFDFEQIGLMGHSRGGEGVVNAVEQNAHRNDPYALRALLPLAATNFERRVPVGIAMATVQPNCDGDVSDLQGVHYYDDGRYHVATDPAERHNVTVHGANHNYFNTVWSPSSGLPGAMDDWEFVGGGDPSAAESPCHPSQETRLSEEAQRDVGVATIGGFFRYHLGGEKEFAPMWRGSAADSVGPESVQVSYHPPAVTGQRLDLDRQDAFSTELGNHLGGETTITGLDRELCGATSCLAEEPEWYGREPHRGQGKLGLQGSRLTWQEPNGVVANTLPEQYGDLTSFTALQFRAGVDFVDASNPAGVEQNLSVVLTDRAGESASVAAADFGDALAYPLTSPLEWDVVPKHHLGQVRVPLAAFDGVNLSAVDSVELVFDQTPSGAVTIADLVFTD